MSFARLCLTVAAIILVPSQLFAVCDCPYKFDPDSNGVVSDIVDVVLIVDIAFRSASPVTDPTCLHPRSDVDTSGAIDVIDVVKSINVAFRNQTISSQYADPSPWDMCPPISPPPPAPFGNGLVAVESRTFPTGQSNCRVGVYIRNMMDITALNLPLELRSLTPGAYIATSFVVRQTTTGRLRNSPLGVNDAGGNWPNANITTRKLPSPDGGTCSGPASTSYSTSAAQIDFVSPDAILHATVAQGDAQVGDSECLLRGEDAPGDPSFELIFTTSNTPGDFEIDTCCVTPANHLVFIGCEPHAPVIPSFTKGIIHTVDPSSPATIQAFPQTGGVGMLVAFSGIAPSSADSWSWEFGDNTTSNLQNPVHVYNTPGVYVVTAVAMRDIVEHVATVSITIDSVKADFSASPRAGLSPMTTNFLDLTVGSPTTWSWHFGDGGTSTAQNPSHMYVTDGWFDVILTASNAGSSSTTSHLHYIRTDSLILPDLAINIYGSTRPRPGFDKCYTVLITNRGLETSSATTLYVGIPAITTYVSSHPTVAVSGDTISWPVPEISPFGSIQFKVCVNVPVGTPLETTLTAESFVGFGGGESDSSNNSDTDHEIVVGSVDPNDKIVQPAGCGPDSNVIVGADPLTYTIFFENKPSATAEAVYVLIVDTLDPNLDWGTLQIGPSSKDNVLTVEFDGQTGEVYWFFDGIELPPNVTPPEGEGYVSYTISPKPGLADGTTIPNRAHIRFDFNDWLAAPEAGPLTLTKQSVCPPACSCPCYADPQCDGTRSDVIDVVKTIEVAFRGGLAVTDPGCTSERSDVDCSGFTDIVDVVKIVDVAFRGANPATRFCDPCL